jgi:ParB family chromosome partitioning protein
MRLSKERVAQVVDREFGRRMLGESDRAQAGNPEGDQVWHLLVDEVDPDPEQPRRHFDEAALNDLAADIARRGVLQPLVVQPVGDRYRIVVGERRWRASKIAGRPRVPCLIRNLDAQQVREAQLVENVIRQGISDIERGLALRRLYEERKAQDRKTTWDSIAQTVGLTRMRINHLYNLSLLPPPVVEMIQTRRLSGSHGVELARLQERRPDLLVPLAQECCRPDTGAGGYRLSVTTLRQRINDLLREDATTDAPEPHRGAGPRILSPAQIARQTREITDALRPGLPEELRQHLRDAAMHILRFLDQEPEPEPETVKSTLQNGGRAKR